MKHITSNMKDNTSYTRDNWTDLKLLGSGATAKVFLAKDTESNFIRALKVFNAEHDEEKASQEAETLKDLIHPRIIQFFDYKNLHINGLGSVDSKSSVLITEYAPKGDLLKLVNAFRRFPDIVTKSYFHQLVEALEYLHAKGIAHGDIKSENILVDETFNLKLADFGSAAKFSKGDLSTKITGSYLYFSPEKHLEESYDPFEADIFAPGVVLFIMVSGSLPFESATKDDELYKFIIEENFEEFWQIHEDLRTMREGYSVPKGLFKPSFKELMNRMLCFDPKRRCSLDEIKRCKYYQETVLGDDKLFDFVNQIATKMRY